MPLKAFNNCGEINVLFMALTYVALVPRASIERVWQLDPASLVSVLRPFVGLWGAGGAMYISGQ